MGWICVGMWEEIGGGGRVRILVWGFYLRISSSIFIAVRKNLLPSLLTIHPISRCGEECLGFGLGFILEVEATLGI